MAENQSELLLVRTASLVCRRVQGGGGHSTGNGGGVLLHKFLVLGIGGGHGENALQGGKNGGFIQFILVLCNLFADIRHEINATGHIIGKITLFPRLGTANHHNTLFKGLGGSGGNVGRTVIVHRITVNQATHGKTGVGGAVLTAEHFLNVRVCGQCTGFLDFVHVQVGNTGHHVLERFSIETLGIKLVVRHSSKLPF